MDMEQPVDSQDSGAENDSVENQELDAVVNETDESTEVSDEQAEEEEYGEIEVDGKKFELPKSVAEKLRSERMMNADYTQKTQALAEQRRAVEAESQKVQEQHQGHQKYVQDYAKAVAINEQLAELNKLNLADYVDSDPVGVQRVMLQKQELEQKLNQAVQAVTQKQEQYALDEKQEIAKRVQEASAYVAREIPGWSAERDQVLQSYVRDSGVPEKDLMSLAFKYPALIKIVHKAELYDRQEKKIASKPTQPVQSKPITRVTGNKVVAQKNANDMSDAEWMAHRDSQLRKKASK